MNQELFESKQVHPIICTRTGITIAALTVTKVAGHVPYLSQWKHTQALHPLFSLEPVALLKFGRNVWTNFCELTQEEASDPQITTKQETLLRVTALAILHQLADVDQTIHWMPTLQEVYTNWTSLMQLSYWKNYLESKRFKFPDLRISKNNKGIDLAGYIHDCWLVKKGYETRVQEAVEQEKLRSAEIALKGIRDDVTSKTPKSKKLLWRWFLAHIPAKYERDTAGWMWELFDAETEAEISEFTMADIDLFEEIFLCEVPTGTSISSAFLARLSYKRKLLETKFETFEILVPQQIAEGVADGSIGLEEPKLADYATKVQFIMAHAKWKLAHTDTSKHRDLAAAKQGKISVTASFIPNIDALLNRVPDEEEEDATTVADLGAIGITTPRRRAED
jgi:hypothetical protein